MLRVTRIAKRRDLSINSVVVVVCFVYFWGAFGGGGGGVSVSVVIFRCFGLLLLCHRHVDSTGASVLLQSIIIQRQAHKTAAFCINETILVR